MPLVPRCRPALRGQRVPSRQSPLRLAPRHDGHGSRPCALRLPTLVQSIAADDPAVKTLVIFAFPSRGIFVLGNQTVGGTPTNVTYWGAQWAKQNSLTGGAPS